MNDMADAPTQQKSKTGLLAHNVSKRFEQAGERIDVLTDVNFELAPGERVAIVGASGSGKSTFLQLLGGLDVPTEGKVVINGHRFDKLSEARRGLVRNRLLGFVYQFHHLLGEFSATENVAMPLRIRGQSAKKANGIANKVLERVGLDKRLSHMPGQLSGGERQRVALARAMVTRPQYVLADEPTGNLDRGIALQVFELMNELSRASGTGFVVVTHDTELAGRMDRILTIRNGQLAPL